MENSNGLYCHRKKAFFLLLCYNFLWHFKIHSPKNATCSASWYLVWPNVTCDVISRTGLSGRTIIISTIIFWRVFKKKLFYYVGGRVKSKTMMLSTDLNNSSCHHWKTVDRKADGHFEWKPFVSSNQERFIKCRSSTTVNTWENVKKISKLPEWNAFVEVNYSCLVTMLKQ